MQRRLAQQRMTLNDLECLKSTSSASRAISAVAKLLVFVSCPASSWTELDQNRPHARKSEVSAIWKCMSEIWGILSP